MQRPLLFLDFTCPDPYDHDTPLTNKIGGTEATVVKVAEGLGKRIPVVVAQHNRTKTVVVGNVRYSPLLAKDNFDDWHAVIVMRRPETAIGVRSQIKKEIPLWLWMHDLISVPNFAFLGKLAEEHIGIIMVSDFHKNLILSLALIDPFLPKLTIKKIYNPISDDLVPDGTEVDKDKLYFSSAPHKGLNYTLKAFQVVRERNPQFKLYVSNPGCTKSFAIPQTGVVVLGSLSHQENLQHMRSSLCLFYPNNTYPETFGLVLAEANAVGTPVLAHPFGAAPEVLLNPGQCINTHEIEKVADKVMDWREGSRPKVALDRRFRLSTIVDEWAQMLGLNKE